MDRNEFTTVFDVSGLAPMTQSFKFSHYSRQVFPNTVSRRWTEVTWNFSHLLRLHHRKAFIKAQSNAGQTDMGEIIFELPLDRKELSKEPFSKICAQGADPSLPLNFVNVNQALVKSKLAVFVEAKENFTELLPKFTVGYHVPKFENSQTDQSIKSKSSASLSRPENNEEKVLRSMRRLNIVNELEHLS